MQNKCGFKPLACWNARFKARPLACAPSRGNTFGNPQAEACATGSLRGSNAVQHSFYTNWRERRLADARAGGIENRVGNGGGGGAAGRFSRAARRKFRVVDQNDLDSIRNVGCTRDRIRVPIHAGHIAAVKRHFFLEAAAERLDQVGLDGGRSASGLMISPQSCAQTKRVTRTAPVRRLTSTSATVPT